MAAPWFSATNSRAAWKAGSPKSANTLRGFQGRRPSLYTREADLAQLDVPLLLICGDEDDPCIEPSLFIHRTAPKSGLAMLPHTGHACNLEEPAAFNALVADFLARAEAGRWGPRLLADGGIWGSLTPE